MARTYEGTHPWIDFSLDTTKFDYRFWMDLGEAASKSAHVAGVPLTPSVADEMNVLYLAKGAAATTAIEGNTLSEAEAEQIVRGQLKLPPSQQYLADEIENVVEAVNIIIRRVYADDERAVTVDLLKTLNAAILSKLEVDSDTIPGEIRTHKVMVGPYRCAPPEDCEYLLERMCETLNAFPRPKGYEKQFSIIKAIFAHLYFVWIHPFGDGNGRTARLLELYILLGAGFPQPTGHLLSNYYNRTRPRYYAMLNNAVSGQQGVIDFISYSVTGLIEGLREQVDFIRNQQWAVSWLSYVHEQFHNHNGPTDVRRRHLVIALTQIGKAVPISTIPKLTPETATEYHGKTLKTVNRDVNALVELGLVERKKNMVRALREEILAFLPLQTDDE